VAVYQAAPQFGSVEYWVWTQRINNFNDAESNLKGFYVLLHL
jgi:hypothetical protein